VLAATIIGSAMAFIDGTITNVALPQIQELAPPSLDHLSARIFATFSGTGFGGLRTTSTLEPKTSSAHRPPRPSYPAHRAGGALGATSPHSPAQAATC